MGRERETWEAMITLKNQTSVRSEAVNFHSMCSRAMKSVF